MSTSEYTSEIAFIKRKIPTIKADWKAMPAILQIASAPMSPEEVQKILAALKDALSHRITAHVKARDAANREAPALVFNKMVFSSPASKINGGSRVLISVPVLREIFGREIDNDFGGGGKGYNPFTNKPKPPGRGV